MAELVPNQTQAPMKLILEEIAPQGGAGRLPLPNLPGRHAHHLGDLVPRSLAVDDGEAGRLGQPQVGAPVATEEVHVLVVEAPGEDALGRRLRRHVDRLAYAAAEALALELAKRRIRVNVLAPGLTDTPMVRRIPGHIESGLPSVPLGELVPPEEVARWLFTFSRNPAQHITGAVYSIGGGRTAG